MSSPDEECSVQVPPEPPVCVAEDVPKRHKLYAVRVTVGFGLMVTAFRTLREMGHPGTRSNIPMLSTPAAKVVKNPRSPIPVAMAAAPALVWRQNPCVVDPVNVSTVPTHTVLGPDMSGSNPPPTRMGALTEHPEAV